MAGLPVPIRPTAAEVSARIAATPVIAEARREHEVALVRSMVGCPWAGEPRVDLAPGPDGLLPLPAWFDWEVGRYAAALLRKRDPAFAAGDLSHLRTRFEAAATVLFVTDVRCRRSRRHPDGAMTIAVAEVVLPAHALGRAVPALPAPAARSLPREVPRLASPLSPAQEPPPMTTTDHPSSRRRPTVARARGARS